MPSGVGHVPRVEVVLLLCDSPVWIHLESIDDAQRAGGLANVAKELNRHGAQVAVNVGVKNLDARHELRQRSPPFLTQLLAAAQWLTHTTRAERRPEYDRFRELWSHITLFDN